MPETSRAEQLKLFAELEPIARRVASRYLRAFPEQRDEILSAARFGLWRAVSRSTPHTNLEALVVVRVRGEILDAFRAEDWLPRRARRGFAAGIRRVFIDAHASEDLALMHDLSVPADAEERIENSELRRAIATLSERDQQIVGAVLDGVSQVDLAHRYGVAPARISQVMRRVTRQLRERMGGVPG